MGPLPADRFVLVLACVFIAATFCATPGRSQTDTSENLLCEGSFEHTDLSLYCWTADLPYGGSVNSRECGDGGTCIRIVGGGSLWQTFATLPGEEYAVRFLFGGSESTMRVSLDSTVIGIVATPQFWGWQSQTFTGLATSASTTLKFTALTNDASLDGVKVSWTHEPPAILSQPRSASTYVGGTVSFDVRVKGAPPITYQWLRNQEPVGSAAAALRTFTIPSAVAADAGDYSVLVTNAFGSVTSSVVRLNVEAVAAPVIVLQPYGGTVLTGAYHVVTVAAVGAPPLGYQWFRNDLALTYATNRYLEFASVTPDDGGSYTVLVSNDLGSVRSLPAHLQVTTTNLRAGDIRLENSNPIYDVDGTTPLSGSNYLAQLYGGPTLDSLMRAGSPARFRTSTVLPGRILGKTVQVPNVPPRELAYVQVRVWEAARGATYEEARALGGKFGRSEIVILRTGGFPLDGSPPVVPPALTNVPSFNLETGLPLFNVGAIQLVERRPGHVFVWSLTGEPGFQYNIERSLKQEEWRPWLILTNTTGTTTFVDPDTPPPGLVLYRARILD